MHGKSLRKLEKILTIDGAQIWTISAGKGMPFILCNGGPGCDDYLQPVSELIEDRCQVIRFEPRGCGRSSYDGRYSLERTILDIEAIRIAYGFERMIIGGHSAGPDTALAYAIQYPQHIFGIIGIAGGRIVNDRDWSASYKEKLSTIGESYGGKVFIADPEVNRIGNLSWRAYIKRPRLLRDLAALEMPVTFINAGEDIRPNWPTQQLAALIPHGQYVEIEGAAHSIWLTHAEELGGALQKSLDRINPLK